jgi:thiamine-monophosphate kinase
MSYPLNVPFRTDKAAGKQSRNRPPAAGELALIGAIRARASRFALGAKESAGLHLGIGDDCALLRVRPGEEIAVTTDLSIAGRHFQLDWHPPEAVGHRTLARGLSDLAAMGARPVAAFLSVGLPQELMRKAKKGGTWFERYLDGFFDLAKSAGTPLAGGDLAQSPMFAADIVLLGAVRRGRALLRSGARPGHLLYVTGTLGGSAAGLTHLAAFAGENRNSLKGRGFGAPVRIPKKLAAALAPHLAPQPRIAVGQALSRRGLATAAIDISDGLSTDLAHICEESRVAAEIDVALLPIHTAATLEQALHGGEDYELLFTAAPNVRMPRTIAGIPITRIGRILPLRAGRPTITLLTPQGPQPLQPSGWQHFA